MLCLLFTHASVVMTTSVLKECLSTLVDGKYLPCLANRQFFFSLGLYFCVLFLFNEICCAPVNTSEYTFQMPMTHEDRYFNLLLKAQMFFFPVFCLLVGNAYCCAVVQCNFLLQKGIIFPPLQH